jgi:hypothetical protein
VAAANYAFGEFLPDLADSPEHLTVAKNVYAIANGYSPAKGFNAITPTLDGSFSGGGAFVASDGTSVLLAATPTSLKRYSGSTWDEVTSIASDGRWYLTQFGDNIIFSNGGQLRSYNMLSEVEGAISGAPSNAIDVATVRDFVMCLTDDHQVIWSEFNDSSGWDAGENQSDTQPLLDGGPGVRIIGGEYALVLQKGCIRKVSYVGGDIVFQFDVISPEIGCMAAGSVANVGRLVFFLSERGFQMCNGVDVTPIGDEKFNRWFFSQFSREDIASMWAAIDPRTSRVYWAMPGTPGLVIAYNWVLQRATVLQSDVAGVFPGFTNNISLDALDALYPTGIDDIPVSLDDPSFAGGNPLLFFVNADNEIGSLTGDSLEATLQVKAIEPTPGRRSRIRAIRLIGDPTVASFTIDARMRRGDAEGIRTAGSMRLSGKCNIRANGRFNDVTVTIPAEHVWGDVQGCEIEFEAGDGR